MNNYKKLAIIDVYPKVKTYKQLSLIENFIFWVGNISSGHTPRNAIFVRPFFDKQCEAQNLLGDSFLVKSNFHGYGGKSYKCFLHKNKFYLVWIDKVTNSLWYKILEINHKEDKNINYLINLTSSKQLTKSLNCNFDSCFIITQKDKLLGLCEKDEKDFLFSIDLQKERQELTVLREFEGFASSLGCNEDKTLLSWIEWKNNMPWENNNLFFGSINSSGQLQKIVRFTNKNINLDKPADCFFRKRYTRRKTFRNILLINTGRRAGFCNRFSEERNT